MKLVQVAVIAFFVFFYVCCNENSKADQIRENKYKNKVNVKHSLFREKDSLERLSVEAVGIPKPIDIKLKNKNLEVKEPERIVALRIVDQYRRIFDYLDFSPVDDKISPSELCVAHRTYKWPRVFKADNDAEYCKKAILKYDRTQKGGLSFVEFCDYMESLWTAFDKDFINKVKKAYIRSKDTFSKLFKWLDRDNDGYVTQQDMLFGISKIMLKDASIKEIRAVYKNYDHKKTGKINHETFILAVINGYLNKSFEDPLISDNFIH